MRYLIVLGLVLLLACTPQVRDTGSVSEEQKEVSTCTTKDCFVTSANNCEELLIKVTEEAGTFAYSTKGCLFTKTVLSVNEEPELKQLLEGKSMTCTYTQGEFDMRLINGLIFGIENCSGDLKDALTGLLAFV